MSVAFRSSDILAFGSHTNSTFNKPAGTADDDILIAAISIRNAPAVTPPADWNTFSGTPFTMWDSYSTYMYWKRAASEGASWTWTHATQNSNGILIACSGAIATGDPNDATPTSNLNAGAADKNVVALEITTATANALGIIVWSNKVDTGGQTPPTGFTEHGDPNNTYGVEDKIFSSAGATGNQTTVIVNNDNWITFFLALKPLDVPVTSGTFVQGWGYSIIPYSI